MSSKGQEILRLQSELARLQAEHAMLEELNRKQEEELKQLEAAQSKIVALEAEGQKQQEKIEYMQSVIDSLQNMMAWFRKKMFGSMSEKNLPLDPSVLEPTLFDMSLSEEEQSALDAEVKKMEEQNAKTIEVKSHKREVRKPVMREDLPVEETHIYPEGVNLDEYTEIGVETTDRIAIRPAVMYIDRTVRHKFVLKSSLQIEDPEKQTFVIAPLPEMIIPKGMASESLLADILIDKYVYHLPFYRVIQKYKELGVLLSDSTIGDWFNAVCPKLRPLYDKLRERIMSSDYIQVDETKMAKIKREDPYGIGITVLSMGIVFFCLALLYVFFRILGLFMAHKHAIKKAGKIQPIKAAVKTGEKIAETGHKTKIILKDGLQTGGIDKEIYIAVIAMALKQYEDNVHDIESNIITIKPHHTNWNIYPEETIIP